MVVNAKKKDKQICAVTHEAIVGEGDEYTVEVFGAFRLYVHSPMLH